jgi:hypothetical protein
MQCSVCDAIVTASITVSTDTEGVEIVGGLILGTLPCTGCGQRLGMTVRVTGHDDFEEFRHEEEQSNG